VSQLVRLIKQYEGLSRLNKDGMVYPYLCPAGYWTQGYGLLVENEHVEPITPAEAERRLLLRIPHYENEAIRACPILAFAHDDIRAAIVDFCFNLGAAKLRASTLRRRINVADWDGACVELAKWVYGGGRKLNGLVLRRADEIKLIQGAK